MNGSAGSLRLKIREYPGLLRLVAHDVLADLTPHIATDLQAEALAETIQRAWLFTGGQEPFAILPRFHSLWQKCGLPDELLLTLIDWLGQQRKERTYNVPERWDSLAPEGLRTILIDLLHAWRQADGTIVFVRTDDNPTILPSILLPFVLRERTSDGEPLARAQDGQAEDIDLCASIDTAIECARRWIGPSERPCIELLTLPGRTGVSIGGGSGGLPVLIAQWLRHKRLKVPALSLGASGVLTSAGGLCSCAAEIEPYREKQKLFSAIGIPTIILPEPMPGSWPCGEDLTPRLQTLATQLKRYREALPPHLHVG